MKAIWRKRNEHNSPLATEGAKCTFYTFEKKTFKDLNPPEKSGMHYKSLVIILSIVYESIVSNETSLRQFSLDIKSYFPSLEITL